VANFMDVLGAILGGASGLGSSLEKSRLEQQAEALKLMELRKGEGTWEDSAPPPDQSFLQRLFSAPLPQGMVNYGGQYRTFKPYDALGDEGAIALGLSTPKAIPAYSGPGPWAPPADPSSPFQAVTPEGIPMGSTPAGVSATQQAAMPWASKLRLDPKAKVALVMEQLKEKARVKELAEKTRLEKAQFQESQRTIEKFLLKPQAATPVEPLQPSLTPLPGGAATPAAPTPRDDTTYAQRVSQLPQSRPG
jgi:hypothetical protein